MHRGIGYMNVYACVNTYISYRYEYMVKCTYINLHVIQMHRGNGYIHMCLPVCIYIYIYVHTHVYKTFDMPQNSLCDSSTF